jgi:hypothetical protein
MTNDLEFDDLLEDDVNQTEGGSLSLADEEIEDLDDLLEVNDNDDEGIHDELPSVSEKNSESLTETNVINRFLRDRGIADPTKLKYENEYGHLEDVNFYELPANEQLSILNGFANETGLTEEESSVVNYMRQYNVSFQQILDDYANQQLQAYASQVPIARDYSVDEYDDDELFVADLKVKYPNFTDDELLDKLDIAKTNEELYGREVAQLREYYRQMEDAQIEEQEQIRQSEMYAFENNVADVLDRFNGIPLDPSDVNCDILTIEDADKDRIAQYLFATDVNGQSQLVKDLSNPAALVELAFYRTQGNLLTDMANYWKNVLKDERKQNAKLKKELESYKSKESTVVIKETPKQSKKNTIASL